MMTIDNDGLTSEWGAESWQSWRALILYRRRRFINHLLTYLLTYLQDWWGWQHESGNTSIAQSILTLLIRTSFLRFICSVIGFTHKFVRTSLYRWVMYWCVVWQQGMARDRSFVDACCSIFYVHCVDGRSRAFHLLLIKCYYCCKFSGASQT